MAMMDVSKMLVGVPVCRHMLPKDAFAGYKGFYLLQLPMIYTQLVMGR